MSSRNFLSASWIKKPHIFLYVIFGLLYLMLAARSPVAIFANAAHDDGLFIRNAMAIMASGWLPAYDQFTLAKGPGMSIFIALNSITGFPINLTLGGLFAFACFVLSITLERAGLSRYWVFLIFLLTLFSPHLLVSRIFRDNFYTTLVVLGIALLIQLFIIPKSRRFNTVGLFGLGISFGFMVITREETLWLAPGAAASVLVYLAMQRELKRIRQDGRAFLFAFLGFLLPISGVATLNFVHFETLRVNDFTQGSFPRAVDAMQSVLPSVQVPRYIPVSENARAQIYEISPTFRQLEGFLESESKAWVGPGCELYPETCGDYAGGWFVWALRDAASSIGLYKKPVETDFFYRQIAEEIETACQSNLLKCTNSQIPFLPELEPADLRFILNSFLGAATFALEPNASLNVSPSAGTEESLYEIQKFLGSPNSTPVSLETKTVLSGWYAGDGWLVLRCGAEENLVEVSRRASPDLVNAFGSEELAYSRFELEILSSEECSLFQRFDDNETLLTPSLSLLSASPSINSGHIDSIRFFDPKLPFRAVFDLKNSLANLHANVQKVLGSLAILSLLFMIIFFRKRPENRRELRLSLAVLIVALSLLLSRLLVIALVDSTSFPAINSGYLAPAIVLVPTILVVPLAMLTSQLAREIKSRRGDGTGLSTMNN